jgi:hypothetical protein
MYFGHLTINSGTIRLWDLSGVVCYVSIHSGDTLRSWFNTFETGKPFLHTFIAWEHIHITDKPTIAAFHQRIAKLHCPCRRRNRIRKYRCIFVANICVSDLCFVKLKDLVNFDKPFSLELIWST